MVPRTLFGVTLIHGSEINVLNDGTLSLEQSYIDKLDYELLVTAAKEYQVALEVNNSSLLKQDRRLNCVENYRRMLKLCKKYSVPVVINSDAHFPTDLGRFDQAINLLNMENFPKELVLNTEDKRLMNFLSIY